jgi:hypothetical protein
MRWELQVDLEMAESNRANTPSWRQLPDDIETFTRATLPDSSVEHIFVLFPP